MGTVIRECPHCTASNSTFTAFAEYHYPRLDHTYTTAFRCGNCHRGIFLELTLNGQSQMPSAYLGNIEESNDFIRRMEYPQHLGLDAPKHVADNIRKFFIQASVNLKSENYDASAMMSRKTLEVAVKKLDPDGTGNLYPRIEALHTKGMITDDLKEWAHIIREDGNEAAHEEEPVEDKFAEELLSFTELFLMYTFTLPGMVKAKKGISEKENGSA